MHTHITRTRREDTWSPAYSICVHRRTYSVQCSDKICFLQLRIKCGVAKSCPGYPHSSAGTCDYDCTYQHFIINLYTCLGQPGGGGSLYPFSTFWRAYVCERDHWFWTTCVTHNMATLLALPNIPHCLCSHGMVWCPWPRSHTVKLHSSTRHWQWSTCDSWGPLEPSTSLGSCHHEKHSSPHSGDPSTDQSLQSVECQDYKCLPISTSLSIRPSLIVGRVHGYPSPIMQNWEVIFLS